MKNTLLAGAALAAVAGTAQAQTTFGNDCAGFSGLTPTIQANSNPIVGTPWQLQINGVPNGFGYLAIGFSNTSSLLGPLPIDLEALFVDPAWAGCDLNVSFDVALQTYFLNGSGVRAINFPSFPSGSIYFQWIGIDPDIVGFSKIAGVSQGIDMQGSVPSGVNPGDLVITEIFKDTSFAFDSEGEWIEILNTTGSAIDIEGFILSDDGSDSHTIDAGGAGVIVPAGGYVTLGINGDCALNGGVTHAYVYGGTNTFFLSNSDDEVVISTAENGLEAIHALKNNPFDLVITDLKMPGANGIEVLKKAGEANPDVQVIIITGYASLETAIEAVKTGAYDYITRPFKLDEMKVVVQNACEKIRLIKENKKLIQNLEDLYRKMKRVQKGDGRPAKGKELTLASEMEALGSFLNFRSVSGATLPLTMQKRRSDKGYVLIELEKLGQLRDDGVLSQDEFDRCKRKILDKL